MGAIARFFERGVPLFGGLVLIAVSVGAGVVFGIIAAPHRATIPVDEGIVRLDGGVFTFEEAVTKIVGGRLPEAASKADLDALRSDFEGWRRRTATDGDIAVLEEKVFTREDFEAFMESVVTREDFEAFIDTVFTWEDFEIFVESVVTERDLESFKETVFTRDDFEEFQRLIADVVREAVTEER